MLEISKQRLSNGTENSLNLKQKSFIIQTKQFITFKKVQLLFMLNIKNRSLGMSVERFDDILKICRTFMVFVSFKL